MNNLQVIENNDQRVLTTAQIAEEYGTTTDRIKNNFNANKSRYIEGKHYYCLTGDVLRDFKDKVRNSFLVKPNANTLYLWTEKGALLHAKSLNTDKAWEAYDFLVDTYFAVKEKLIPALKSNDNEIRRMEAEAKLTRARALQLNAENRRMKMLLEHPNMNELSPIALETLGLRRFEQATGVDVGNALPETEMTYSATEAGKMLGGISANKIGSTANKHGLKIDKYGKKVMDKSRYSTKEVPTFRYNMAGVYKLAEILGCEVHI